ncbi:hypothetical protein CXG81DRAFT_20865 [Caulochytrium protostelioides]|uniref:Uncharacterized protein n=1 Tax=Caulochytrium protostelioides TaxID=1555241 RepID=A0A4V1IU17_9FUNG|nr:hypothetical protein CXG81DRAFT_20865 [Caulochytrium protostelioides]|eukprot:RKO98997.1 hypothetical protein CXG81DRAFT_20865 [Caulochytrium protostelioides]
MARVSPQAIHLPPVWHRHRHQPPWPDTAPRRAQLLWKRDAGSRALVDPPGRVLNGPVPGAPTPPHPTNSSSSSTAWSRFRTRFRSAPGSFAIAFAVLHELTAILPLPLVYYLLSVTDALGWVGHAGSAETLSVWIPDGWEEEARRRMTYWSRYFGADVPAKEALEGKAFDDAGREDASLPVLKSSEPDFQESTWITRDGAVRDMIATYLIVKAAMPLRIAASLYLTPWMARYVALFGKALSCHRMHLTHVLFGFVFNHDSASHIYGVLYVVAAANLRLLHL